MPRVGKKHYPYTKEGYKAADKERKKKKKKKKKKTSKKKQLIVKEIEL